VVVGGHITESVDSNVLIFAGLSIIYFEQALVKKIIVKSR